MSGEHDAVGSNKSRMSMLVDIIVLHPGAENACSNINSYNLNNIIMSRAK